MIFPYRAEDYYDRRTHSWIVLERPHIWAKIIHADGRAVSVPALIDSGADVSLIGPIYAAFLGIDIKSGTYDPCNGLTGEADCYLHEGIAIEISDGKSTHQFEISADLTESWEHDFIILGRKDVFERFKVVIDESLKQIELIPKKTAAQNSL